MRLPAFLRRSVRAKITALVVTTTLAALVLSAVALIYYTMRDYRQTQLFDIRTQAEILGRASAPALAFNDRKEAVQDLAMLKARPDVEQAALYGADGRLFAAYARNETPVVPLRAEEPGHRIEDERLKLFYPVLEGGQLLGMVYLESRYRLLERLSAYVLILAVVMVAALAAALALSAWLQRAVTEPILRAAEAAHAVVEERNFSVRAGKLSEDEIGVLAEAMNRMLADLEREIDERRGAEEALRVVDRRKDEFLATLAHELRNPLAPVRNAVYLMQAAPDNLAVAAEARAIIERHVRQMVRLIDDLLDVSRITTGRLALRRERVDLRALVASALEAAMPLLRERGHRLNVDLPAEGVSINADATRLIQVFLNLLNNAAKFTAPGGHIDFAVTVHGAELVAIVRDDGIGIAPEMHSEIFEMFVQVDRSLERASAGLGVGLALSRRLVELHGGTLEVKSEGPDKGAEFSVRIPGIVVDAAPSQPAAGERAGADTSAQRVLVVDDNRDFADSTAMLLGSLGHVVRVAYDGAAGLDTAAQFAPHIAFLDIGMPKLNGYELAQRLRGQSATARTILVAVSGWSQAHDQRRALEAGFDEFLVKPVDPERIIMLLQRR